MGQNLVGLLSPGTARRRSLDTSLDAWIAESPHERRQRLDAAAKIRICYKTHSSKLDLSGLGLTSLPDCLHLIHRVTNLSLSRNRLRALPECLGSLRNLELLDLSYNSLEQLPPNTGQLEDLAVLNLRGNRLRELPQEWVQIGSRVVERQRSKLDRARARVKTGTAGADDEASAGSQTSSSSSLARQPNIIGPAVVIRIGENNLPPESVANLKAVCPEHVHLEVPDLAQEIRAWFDAADRGDYPPVADSVANDMMVAAFFVRLRNVGDLKPIGAHASYNEFAHRVCEVMKMLGNPESEVYQYVLEAERAAAARTQPDDESPLLKSFGRIEAVCLARKTEATTMVELVRLGERCFNRQLVDEVCKERIASPSPLERTNARLAFREKLRAEKVALPARPELPALSDMHPAISEQDVKAAIQHVNNPMHRERKLEYLTSFEPFRAYLKRTHPQQFADLDRQFKQRVELLKTKIGPELETRRMTEQIAWKQKSAETLYRKLVGEAMNELAKAPATATADISSSQASEHHAEG
ncbi:NEL-type E3 ubiquitin ligase domain-containing protein [Paraburkholderia sediminicola]|uniref:NEL-type E3 ubiquitin ligase domain-containing protein n=1 Tax=Paraburkholderia sediminicola TaxID=458836 RepID=UPI0038BA78ED